MNKFVIACFARTGSYRLVDMLNQQHGVICHGEIFKKGRVEVENEYLKKISFQRSDVKKRDEDPVGFMENLFGAMESEGALASGFKIFPSHNQEALEYALTAKDYSVVCLCRNPFQQYVSLKVARNTGVWVNRGESGSGRIETIEFNPKDFVKRMNLMFSYYNKIRLLSRVSGKKILEIDYDDSLSGKGVGDVIEHIGTNGYREVSSSHEKIINKTYDKVVANWSEARSFLSSLGVDENMNFFDFYKAIMKQ